MSNSNNHDHAPLPTLIVGTRGGRIKGNNHVRYPDRTRFANLLVTLLDRADVPIEQVGDSSALLEI
jgi:hypothetical protein